MDDDELDLDEAARKVEQAINIDKNRNYKGKIRQLTEDITLSFTISLIGKQKKSRFGPLEQIRKLINKMRDQGFITKWEAGSLKSKITETAYEMKKSGKTYLDHHYFKDDKPPMVLIDDAKLNSDLLMNYQPR